jgi:hypothetical protein
MSPFIGLMKMATSSTYMEVL